MSTASTNRRVVIKVTELGEGDVNNYMRTISTQMNFNSKDFLGFKKSLEAELRTSPDSPIFSIKEIIHSKNILDCAGFESFRNETLASNIAEKIFIEVINYDT